MKVELMIEQEWVEIGSCIVEVSQEDFNTPGKMEELADELKGEPVWTWDGDKYARGSDNDYHGAEPVDMADYEAGPGRKMVFTLMPNGVYDIRNEDVKDEDIRNETVLGDEEAQVRRLG